MYLKITNKKENHNGLQYYDGLNIDNKTFENGYMKNGICFTTKTHIFTWIGLNNAKYIRNVYIPKNVEIDKHEDALGKIWKTQSLIFGNRRDLYDINTWKWLIKIKAPIHKYNYAINWAKSNELTEIINLIENYYG
jgi:hypothetical protein